MAAVIQSTPAVAFLLLSVLTQWSAAVKQARFLLPEVNATMNVIDACWGTDPNWASNRKALAKCSIGFGANAGGGMYGNIYLVTDPSDNAQFPTPGTLRYGVTRMEPLWIIFERDMVIKLQNELIINSFKTIDGRGVKVEITDGPCLTIQGVENVIVHGISIHDCKPGKSGRVMSSAVHTGRRRGSDGDAIAISSSSNIWIDHCYLASCTDGLVDVIHGSTDVTISNNFFTSHNKVMLLGHLDGFVADLNLKVTVVFNHFGPELTQRMPRVRMGYAHVANNRYDPWMMYAVGGSSNPTIFSEGNYFLAPDNIHKQVTKREPSKNGWKNWKWRSSRDVLLNGAYFVQTGYGSIAPNYNQAQRFTVLDGSMVPMLTGNAGPLNCVTGKACLP